LDSTLFAALDQQDAHVAAGDLASLDLPVTLIFGAANDYQPRPSTASRWAIPAR
jgi:hypothetical protein